MSPRIYLDNAATSFPKPPAVLEAMMRYATELGASPGRGAYSESQQAGQLLEQCRSRICQLIGGSLSSHVIFTLNATDALNLAIHGILRHGDHAITTYLDHNSVLRPLNALVAAGTISQTRVECDPVTGLVEPDAIRRAIRPETRLIAVAHGSNVTGTLQPLRELGRIARERGICFLVDAAQTAGHVPLDAEADFLDLVAFPGHKGLLGPLGTGALYVRPEWVSRLSPVRQGGTGSVSESDFQPDFLPDRYEPGSHNAIGLIGLSEGVGWVLERGVAAQWEHEQRLVAAMLQQLAQRDLPGLALFGPPTSESRLGVFSFRLQGYDRPQALSDLLEQRFGLLTRSGLHCAPLAHQTVGTLSLGGTTRFSFGPFTTTEQIESIGEALEQLSQGR